MLDIFATHYNYLVFVALVGIGLYGVIESSNLVKKVIGMNIFQVGIFLFFVTTGYVDGGSPPVVHGGGGHGTYASPLPHVLILTAIVVGVSLTAVALALIVRIYEEYGTLDEEVIKEVRLND
ncbi:cation:proton antiporter subunit C [Halopelagius fulvigenes]|uniref:Cation:proton antiporter subunit C n=1 Tax=Halopelagius fulvigenes TaxID=1198324 RepID=A0ABD5TZU1_9EURY